MKSVIDKAQRLWKIPGPALGPLKFIKKRLVSRGVELIDLESVVPYISPDLLKTAENIQPFSYGVTADHNLIAKLKSKIAEKHLPLRSVGINPETEIAITPGIRMTTSLLALSLLNPDDIAAYPDPGMQYFRTAICLADAVPHPYPLAERNDYIPNLPALTEPPINKLRMLFVSYPHNPSTSCADYYFYRDLLKSIKFENIIIASDNAYVHPGDSDAVSLLQITGSKKKAVEMHSFSTAFGIDGIGFVVGHRDVISILDSLLSALGYLPDVYRVKLALAALERSTEIFAQQTQHIGNLRKIASSCLKELNWRIRGNDHTPFLWINPQAKSSSLAFARRLIIKAGVRLAPGTDFGEGGEGWLRLALCHDENMLSDALNRISHHSKIWQRKYRPKKGRD